MENVIQSKHTSNGVIEIRQSGSDYCLYVNGSLQAYSSDFGTIKQKYDQL